jgi:curved DNA-binding protein CbpA
MDEEAKQDHYEVLQISKNADSDTIQRVFRLLARRFHPDNPETGNESRFREIHEAYLVLSDPEKRAAYDVRHETLRQERWRFVQTGPTTDNDFALEQHVRWLVLEILYSRRRTEPERTGVSNLELSQLLGRPREHMEFTVWYLIHKGFVVRGEGSSLNITVDGVDFLEKNPKANLQRLRLADRHAGSYSYGDEDSDEFHAAAAS